jgi:Sec-independent protein secretion pathway component TatC
MKGYRRHIYMGIIIIAVGVSVSTTSEHTIGTVLIAIGGLFFIIGMSKKRREEETDENK